MNTIVIPYDDSLIDRPDSLSLDIINRKWYPKNGFYYKIYERELYGYEQISIISILEKNSYNVIFKDIKNINVNDKCVYQLSPNFSITDKRFSTTFIPKKIVESINNGQCLLIINDTLSATLYNDELDNKWIDIFNRDDIVNHKSILFLTAIFSQRRDNKIKIIYYPHAELAIKFLAKHATPIDIKLNEKILNWSLGVNKLIKFLCFNGTTHSHRCWFANELYKNSLLDCTSISFPKPKIINDKVHFSYLDDTNCEFANALYKDKVEFHKFLNACPFTIDVDEVVIRKNPWGIFPNTYRIQDDEFVESKTTNPEKTIDMYYKHGIYIITETLVKYNHVFITEKTFKSMATKMPFMIFGMYNTLHRLHEMGYKTFSDFWNEDYDIIEDPMKRGTIILENLKVLSKLSDVEFIDLYKKMVPILEHNYNNLLNSNSEKYLVDEIKKHHDK